MAEGGGEQLALAEAKEGSRDHTISTRRTIRTIQVLERRRRTRKRVCALAVRVRNAARLPTNARVAWRGEAWERGRRAHKREAKSRREATQEAAEST